MLAKGKWGDQIILSDRDYLREATRPSQQLNPSYGYLWWLNGQRRTGLTGRRASGTLIDTAPKDLYAAQGALGRKCYVVPSAQLVVVRIGDDPEVAGQPRFASEFWRLLKQAAPARRTQLQKPM